VTLLQANGVFDAGDIWASRKFETRPVSKSALYRYEVTQAAIEGLLETIEHIEGGKVLPEPLDYSKSDVQGRPHAPMNQRDRAIDWSEPTALITRKIRSGDSSPGVLDQIDGTEYYLYGVHEEDGLKGIPGQILAWRDGAICRATGDGALWISHLKHKKAKNRSSFKLPATLALGSRLKHVPFVPAAVHADSQGRTFREIWYEEQGEVGSLDFNFYNGAMSTGQCCRLKESFLAARQRPTKVIVLMGGSDFWSNGIDLNVIEAAQNPGDESWSNINALNDLIREIILTESHVVLSAMQGNAAAGGVMLALAADQVYARHGAVLNPHYRAMGELYGSEYWTYLLPRRVGWKKALDLTDWCLPITTRAAEGTGLIDRAVGDTIADFRSRVVAIAQDLVGRWDESQLLVRKRQRRLKDEQRKPLEQYRAEELKKVWANFHGPTSCYHAARQRFVYKIPQQGGSTLNRGHAVTALVG
jgi:putative two-component system hydrogenase maturation factor HypX/HoxX